MTEGCVTCDSATPLSQAISTMTRMHIHRLIVTERRGEMDAPIGVLSLTDIVRRLIVENE